MLRGFCLAWGGLPGPGVAGEVTASAPLRPQGRGLVAHFGALEATVEPEPRRAVRPGDRSGGQGRSLLTLPLAGVTVNTKLGSGSSMSHLRHMYSMPRL